MQHLTGHVEKTEEYPECPYFAVDLLLRYQQYGISPFTYDGLGFEGFEQRLAQNSIGNMLSLLQIHISAQPHVSDSLQQSKWQEWLYLGLLHTVLGIYPEVEHFLEHHPQLNKCLISSAQLNMYCNQATDRLLQMPSNQHRFDFLQQTRPALRTAIDQIKELCNQSHLIGQNIIDPQLALSIVMLIDVLCSWRNWHYAQLSRDGFNNDGFNDRVPLDYDLAQQLLSWDGWCRADVYRLVQDSEASPLGWNSLFLASRLRRDRIFPPDHAVCELNRCRYQSEAQPANMLNHTSDGCNCEGFIGPDSQELFNMVLASGNTVLEIPLVDAPECLVISRLIPVSLCRKKYVAISHVWAHGLGNSKGNYLRRCQLLRLVHYVSKVIKLDEGETTIRLWLDSLCIPRGNGLDEARKEALKSMERVYPDAQSVLVLDYELLNLRRASWSLSTWLKFLFSDWMQRVWTLEEGLVAPKIFLQFSDGAMDYDAVINSENWLFETPIQRYIQMELQQMTLAQLVGFERRRQHSVQATVPVNPGEVTDLDRIWEPLRLRYTTHPGDQFIVLAFLMRQDHGFIETLWNSPIEQRMQLVLKKLNRVPRRIIFTSGLRCPDFGFRWAPSDVLGTEPILGDELADISPQGLTGRYSGIDLRRKDDTSSEAPVEVVSMLKLSSLFFINVDDPRQPGGPRLILKARNLEPIVGSDQSPSWPDYGFWAIILEAPWEPQGALAGVLVQVEDDLTPSNGTINCHWHFRIRVEESNGVDSNQPNQFSLDGRWLRPDQNWLID